jgi:uncharacterized protein YjbI with pentapeptide repeats
VQLPSTWGYCWMGTDEVSADQGRTGWRRRLGWSLAGVAGVALLATALWICIAVLPQLLYPPLSNADLSELSAADQAARREGRAKVQNDARTTLLQGLAALLVLGGAGITAAVTLRQVRISRQQLKQAREDADRSDKRLGEQIAVAQEGQITERFTRAVDQLGQPGPDRLDVRLGGIYALERIAHDSPTHRLAVVELLTAFVRTHAPWPPRLPGQYKADAPIDQVPPLQNRAPDVQAVLTIIGRRLTQKDDPLLHLNDSDLRRATLNKMSLAGSQLGGANLAGATLIKADLTKAQLDRADLRGATLWLANLTEARLHDANLTGARLYRADLTKAQLDQANLTGAQLTHAKLREAKLDQANLTEARLHEANLTGARLYRADLTKARLGQANLTGAELIWANLTEVQLSDANLTGVLLVGANLTRAQLIRANLTGANLGATDSTGLWLYDGDFGEVALEGANLTDAQLGRARANRQTIWPEGWDRTRRAAAGVHEPDEEAPPAASPPGKLLDP